MNENTKAEITKHLSEVMERLIDRRCNIEPFNAEETLQKNPFGARLVPFEIWKGSKFERSFVTVLGQGIFEQLAKIIALGTGAEAVNQHITKLTICSWKLEKIDSIVTRGKKTTPNWEEEVKDVLALENDRFEEVEVISDLYIKRNNGTEEFYSFKTVKPNLDQTEKAKKDMLRLIAGNKKYKPYFALPYNPAGEGELYRKCGFSIPYKIFDMDNDSCVLIGSKLWNKIGDSPNTYLKLLEIFQTVGQKYTPIIKKEYLGI